LQSTILFGALSILTVVIQAIPIVRLLAGLVGLVTFVLWLYLMVSGFTGKKVVLPVLGDVCWEQVNK
jgi:uncharacterized membrane protein